MSQNKKEAHGGNIYLAEKRFGIKQEDFLDYSANINPFGLPKRLKELLNENVNSLVNYPDPLCADLVSHISQYLSVNKENIIVGNGASEVISLFLEVLAPKKVLMLAPTFSEYQRACALQKIEVEYYKLLEENKFKLNVEQFISEISEEIDLIFLCNPNNPTSTLINKDDLIRIIDFAAAKGVNVVVDEAFIELTPKSNENSIVEFTTQYENLFVIRAFTKLFAMPGLRLGYGIGYAEKVSRMWEKKLAWSVNSFACCLGPLLTEEKEYLHMTCDWISEEKDWFYNILFQFHEFKVFKPETNFVLVKLVKKGFDSHILREEMGKRGVLIRDASNFVSLNEKFVRFAIRDRESNLRFLKELKSVLAIIH